MNQINAAIRITITGIVQGVGFRPFIYCLANELGITGWILNDSEGVQILACAKKELLDELIVRIERDKPSAAQIQDFKFHSVESGSSGVCSSYSDFQILPSRSGSFARSVLPADLAICDQCKEEILDPENRRYQYPFTNCTQCGPRFSIVTALPYDRPNTSMDGFVQCPECLEEYSNPQDRRFHAQPNACHLCGPTLALINSKGEKLAHRQEALTLAVRYLKSGGIIAIKGLGGFHLMCDARNDTAVQRLRRRKAREEKPLAVMVPDIGQVKQLCHLTERAEILLRSETAPIIILQKKLENDSTMALARSISPTDNTIGVMLPYTPLHVLLMNEVGFPLVATSGNVGDEPICTDNNEAFERLAQIADFFLWHNRPIIRSVDDSVIRPSDDAMILLRRSRGYAPNAVILPVPVPDVLCCGGHLKNTVAVAHGHEVVVSQHIGDLENNLARIAFENAIELLKSLYYADPEFLVCDAHPDYPSTHYAVTRKKPVMPVQHHYAHVLAALAENGGLESDEPVLGVSWDGTGYGLDGTIWGGEFLMCDSQGFTRIGHLRPFTPWWRSGSERATPIASRNFS